MTDIRKNTLLVVEAKASESAGRLSRELVTAQTDEVEGIQAGIAFERWLSDSCGQCRRRTVR